MLAMALPLMLFCGGSCRPHPPLTLRRLSIMFATLTLNPDGFALALQRLRSMLAKLALNLNAFAFCFGLSLQAPHSVALLRWWRCLRARPPLAARSFLSLRVCLQAPHSVALLRWRRCLQTHPPLWGASPLLVRAFSRPTPMASLCASGLACKHRTASLCSAGGGACGHALRFRGAICKHRTASLRSAGGGACRAPLFVGSLRSPFLAVGCLYNARYARVKQTPYRSGCAPIPPLNPHHLPAQGRVAMKHPHLQGV